MDIADGAYALFGVLLGGLLAEVRAWREAVVRRSGELLTVKRDTYLRALTATEAMASEYNKWASEGGEAASVWEAITAGYAVLNEARLLVTDLKEFDSAFDAVIRIYRDPLEEGHKTKVKAREARQRLVSVLRDDLGVA